MARNRIAAIDVGTNSIHMIVVEKQRHGFRVIDKEKDMVQLGRGSLEGRPLTKDAMERGIETLRHMAEIAQRWRVDEVAAVATSAIREAPNGRQFIRAAQRAAGIKIRVISGEEEADYIYRAVRAAVDFHGGTGLVIDVGGGSIELIVGTHEEVYFTGSERLGALRLAQMFELDGPATKERLAECRAFARKRLKAPLARVSELGFDFAVGTSGTIVTLASLASSAGQTMASGLTWLSRKRLRRLIDELAPLTVSDRAREFAVDERRAETILAGAVVLDEIMRKLDMQQLRACDAALREGIVEVVFDRAREHERRGGSVRRTSVLALMGRSSVERAHATHVARLALRIFDQTQELHRFRMGERELLEYAALLHEVGTHVAYQKHHKHSYYLISHAGLRGFTPDQVAVLANVARYYRKTPPDETHDNFAQLSPSQKDIVRRLTAILRIADGLDRGRRRAVGDVGVHVSNGAVRFEVHTSGDAAVELTAATKRAKYFGKVFEKDVAIESSTS